MIFVAAVWSVYQPLCFVQLLSLFVTRKLEARWSNAEQSIGMYEVSASPGSEAHADTVSLGERDNRQRCPPPGVTLPILASVLSMSMLRGALGEPPMVYSARGVHALSGTTNTGYNFQ